MFTNLTVRGSVEKGSPGTLLWGYHQAVVLTSWAIKRNDAGEWKLVGTIGRVDRFQARQTPLLFTAPHEQGRDGWWAWAVESIVIGERKVVATLGPPEQ